MSKNPRSSSRIFWSFSASSIASFASVSSLSSTEVAASSRSVNDRSFGNSLSKICRPSEAAVKITSPVSVLTSVSAPLMDASTSLLTKLSARATPIETDNPRLPPTDPAMAAAPAMAEIPDLSVALSAILPALTPPVSSSSPVSSPSIKDLTLFKILLSALTPAPDSATPALPPPARATDPASTGASIVCGPIAVASSAPLANTTESFKKDCTSLALSSRLTSSQRPLLP